MAADARGTPPEGAAETLRLDKWLWHARFLKTRSLASRAVAGDGVRINGARTTKPAAAVRPGDVLTFALGDHVRVIRVAALGVRRGPASEARALYEDLDPPPARAPKSPRPPEQAERPPGAGRPTKRERRATDRLKGDPDGRP